MPSRVPQHQIDAAGQVLLRSALPPAWVVREQNPDYGIDYQIEIFEENGSWTGVQFSIQLKSSAAQYDRNIPLQLPLEKLAYWSSQALPVAVVVAAIRTSELRFRWAHDLDPGPHVADEQITSTFQFRPRDAWCEESPAEIRRYADAWRTWNEHHLTTPVALSILPSGVPGALDERMARDALLRELVENSDIMLLLPPGRKDVGGIILECDRHETRFAVPGSRHMVFAHPGACNLSPERLGPDLLVGIGLTLSFAGVHEAGARLISSAIRRSGIWREKGLALWVALALQDGRQ